MPMARTKTADPLEKLKEGVRASVNGAVRPVPLVATAIAVRIDGGIAVVSTERTFRNIEDQDIEPTLTFPVPTDAVMFSLLAEIDGRHLQAECKPKETARETYEDAIDRGKAAVLHEELLKGVHMVSVGRVRPGAEVKVTSIWTAPLSFVGGEPGLRVPTTVGEIYGRQPMPDSDALTVGDHLHRATVSIECVNGQATLLGGPREVSKGGSYDIALDAPIEIAVAGWKPARLQGVASDGRQVAIDVTPAPRGESALDVDLLVDRSGSMNEPASGARETGGGSKFDAMMRGLMHYADTWVGSGDRVRAWEFDDAPRLIGSAEGKPVKALFAGIGRPRGSTELGRALDMVIATEGAKNVVLATDGKTWALDTQKYARMGVRVTAVLIGEDALDANVAALAGITGGEIIVPVGPDTDRAIADALNAARLPFAASSSIEGLPTRVETCRRGAQIDAVWSGKSKSAPQERDLMPRAVAALAAGLAVPLMSEDAASSFAASEGIVCHLTSLVLVDEATAVSEGVPANRKVDLSRPRTAMMSFGLSDASAGGTVGLRASSALLRARSSGAGLVASASAFSPRVGASLGMWNDGSRKLTVDDDSVELQELPTVDIDAVSRMAWSPVLQTAGAKIDWDAAPDDLRAGDLASLSASIADAIRSAAADKKLVEAAKRAGIDPVVFVIGLLARAAGAVDRTASRIARLVLKGTANAEVVAAARLLGV